ncbi:hypothetical protein BK655_02140 [Pseudomonas brassicacearum]|nr:hypothetical protein CVG87_10505 [Pseudomonas sp. WCS365]ROM88372.1 hypothetical protein BK655_02140 [Pseudomonas brassicacearum]ROM99493.1 hypothetical protein BK656_01810 [Pseudomonas brassicacearum]RON05886.1 hypothetical protein BK657_05775 [Pseudomonas brassicacearum]
MVDIPKRPVAGVTGVMRCLTQSSGNPQTLWERAVWEQSLLAIQALRSSRDRGVFIAGKPCSHTARSHIGLLALPVLSPATQPGETGA